MSKLRAGPRRLPRPFTATSPRSTVSVSQETDGDDVSSWKKRRLVSALRCSEPDVEFLEFLELPGVVLFASCIRPI